jgi:hypothetical protein
LIFRSSRGGSRRSTSVHGICAQNAKYQVGLWWDNPFFGPHPSSNDDAGAQLLDPEQASIRFDRNIYWCEKGQLLALWGVPWRSRHKEYAGLAAWQKERGQDANSILAEPRFADPARDDWSIEPPAGDPRPKLERK